MLSVIVITKNEEDRIRACLESVKWADELIVLDNGSTDQTLKIAKEYTPKTYINTATDFSLLRNQAVRKSCGDWILFVDADERVLEPLRREITGLVFSTPHSAIAISRKNIIFGREVKYGPFWPDWVIRLLKRKDFKEYIGEVHEQPTFNGTLGYSKNSFLHLTHRDLDQIVLKSLEWSRIDAGLRLRANHPKMSGWRFLRIFISEVFNQGIKRRGFFSGDVGIMDSLLQTFSLYMSYIRLWELQQPPLDEKYAALDEHLINNGFTYP